MKKMNKTLPKILVAFTLLLGVSIPVYAQTSGGIEESKIVVSGTADETGNLNVELYGNPGDTLNSTTKVTNLSEETLKIKTELLDFIVESENGVPTFVESGSSIWSMSKWIGVAEEFKEFLLEPNESKDIPFTIDVPQDATPGGHYTSILFTPVIVEEDVVGPLIEHKLGTYVKLTVSGDIKESAEIVEFSAPFFSEFGPVPLTLKILNDGNTHIPVSGTVKIENTLGNQVAEWVIKPANIFPTAVRLWETEWKGTWRFGIYRAEVELSYGTGDLPLSSEVYFWVIPWKIVIAVLVVVILLIIAGYNKDKKKTLNKKSGFEKEPTEKVKLPIINKLDTEETNGEKI